MTPMLLLVALASAADRPISLDEIARHATPEDCWFAVDDGVYNATTFVRIHPGGPIIETQCGKDATKIFHNRPEMGTDHSDTAKAALATFRIGTLPGALARTRLAEIEARASSGAVASVPTPALPSAHVLRVDLGHQLGEDNNVRIGFTYGISDKVAVELVHGTINGESDVGVTAGHGTRLFRAGLHAGVGYRFRNVPDGDGMGIYAELPLELNLAQRWLTVDLTPGLAVLPQSAGDVARGGGGVGLTVRPWPIFSFFGEARLTFADLAPEWNAGVRFHTSGHTFGLWAGSSYALTALDRLAPAPDATFAVGFSLTRDFRLGKITAAQP